ncbi:hypothetical protein [Bordetella flabilis]|uniref:Uncharacterized protein n=1 Tax=Bordetella flabilis TaxID=463014 RepID=A0A193GL92_9BORD|nr:hypothetical protein [Bordetella flabilis]ANN80862.1 hypothetical protein BAU07_26435 [Bordetella flabilis]
MAEHPKSHEVEALTPLQEEALATFRDKNGRNWKSALRDCWERARYPGMTEEHSAALQRVRNTLGPEWLMKYRVPELQKSPQVDRYERINGIKNRLAQGGDDPKWLDQLIETMRTQDIASLADSEITRVFGSVMLSHFCIEYVKSARACGLTLDDVRPATALGQHASVGPDDVSARVDEAERRLRALGLEILSEAEIAAWNRDKNEHGALYPDVSLTGWVELDGFLTKEFYVRDAGGDAIGVYRKAWFGDYAGSDDKELFITDADGNEIDLDARGLEP